jgi:hypothetical protein
VLVVLYATSRLRLLHRWREALRVHSNPHSIERGSLCTRVEADVKSMRLNLI